MSKCAILLRPLSTLIYPICPNELCNKTLPYRHLMFCCFLVFTSFRSKWSAVCGLGAMLTTASSTSTGAHQTKWRWPRTTAASECWRWPWSLPVTVWTNRIWLVRQGSSQKLLSLISSTQQHSKSPSLIFKKKSLINLAPQNTYTLHKWNFLNF